MIPKTKTDYISYLILIGSIVLLLEISFFNKGLIFSLLVAGGMIYIGRKKKSTSKIGKLLFWLGLFFLIISIMNMITFKVLSLILLCYLLILFIQSKKKKEYIQPFIKEKDNNIQKETIIQKSTLFENVFFGQQRTPDHVYEWNDINIQAGIGDTVIDLSFTVLPKGETVIFVRNLIGKMEILIPYDMEVTVNHSSIVGSTNILGLQAGKSFNQVLHVQTADYQQADQKVKIYTSMFIGDLEVKRV